MNRQGHQTGVGQMERATAGPDDMIGEFDICGFEYILTGQVVEIGGKRKVKLRVFVKLPDPEKKAYRP
jgi:hypothetical protein